MNRHGGKYWLSLVSLALIIFLSIGYISVKLYNNHRNRTLPVSGEAEKSSRLTGLDDMPDSFEKDSYFYTPLIPIKYKVEMNKEILLEGEGINPRVSPSGNLVVLKLSTGTKNCIAVADLVRNKIDRLDLEFDDYADPSWNFNGTKIVFAGVRGAVSEIYTYDLENKKIFQLTNSPERKKYWPRFSPYQFDDQYKVAYVSEAKKRKDIWWVKESGKDDQPITLPQDDVAQYKKSPYWQANSPGQAPDSFIVEGGDSPEWSPSGEEIIYRKKQNSYASLNYSYNSWWKKGSFSASNIKGVLSWAPNKCSLLEYDSSNRKTNILAPDNLKKKEILNGRNITSTPSFFPDGRGLAYIYKKNGKAILAVEPYDDPSGDISNLWLYGYNARQKDKLIKNKLILLHQEFGNIYDLYDKENYRVDEHERPYFITSDALLETYYAAFSALLGYAETVEFNDAMKEFASNGLQEAKNQNVSRDVKDLFLVGMVLINPNTPEKIPEDVQNKVKAIKAASGPKISFMDNEIDPKEFFIRGKYEKDKELQNYFRALKWFQSFKFDLRKENHRKYIAEILKVVNTPKALSSLNRINLFLKNVIGESRYYTPLTLKNINSPIVVTPDLQWIKMEQIFKIFPSIYTLDAFIFDNLIYHENWPETVGTEENPRVLPLGMDIMGALGSEEAKNILLNEFKEGRYKNYGKKLNELSLQIKQLPADSWNADIYQNWLEMFSALIDEPVNGPEFTKSKAWKRKQLNTALGSWVSLRYETIAYVEQAGAEGGEGGYERLKIGMPRGYVEPNPDFFHKLDEGFGKISARFRLIIKNPELRDAVVDRIEKYRKHIKTMEAIALKELDNKVPTDEEYAEILYIGRTIEHFIKIMGSIVPRKDDGGGLSVVPDQDSLRKVVDVQRFNGEILYEALGYAHEINVVVPYFGRRQIVRGPVYSYYEFRSTEQYDSAKWKKEKSYKQPEWIQGYYEDPEKKTSKHETN